MWDYLNTIIRRASLRGAIYTIFTCKVHQDARFDLLDETDAVCCIPRNHEFQLLLMLLQLPQPKGLLDDATRILLSRPREHSLALL